MYSCGNPHMDVQKQDDQHELTYSSYVRTQDVTLKTCRRRWMIGRSGERGSGISVLAARHDDGDDDDYCWYWFLYEYKIFWGTEIILFDESCVKTLSWSVVLFVGLFYKKCPCECFLACLSYAYCDQWICLWLNIFVESFFKDFRRELSWGLVQEISDISC